MRGESGHTWVRGMLLHQFAVREALLVLPLQDDVGHQSDDRHGHGRAQYGAPRSPSSAPAGVFFSTFAFEERGGGREGGREITNNVSTTKSLASTAVSEG